MPPYKEQGVVLRSAKLGEADKIVTIMTQGSGKVRGVAKGIRKTTSRFGARLEPFTHVNLMLYRGRGSLDTITQAEIIAPHRAIRDHLALFAAGETMLEAVDRVAEEHERNVRLVLLLLSGLRALETKPADPAAVAESFVLKLLSVSGFHPSLTACAVCGSTDVQLFSAGLGGAVCAGDAEPGAGHVSGGGGGPRGAPPPPPPAPVTSRPRRSRTWGPWPSRTSPMRAPRPPPRRAPGRRRAGSCSASPSTTWSAG
jgi:DNA repair protein RecO (recombination protein O)